LAVADVYPKRIPDLFSAKPIVLSGRYTGSGRGVIRLQGKISGRDFTREIPVNLPEAESRHSVLPTLWARARIDDLMSQDYNGIQSGNARPEVSEAITNLGLEFRLMTQFTSFVAVEEMTVTDGGEPRRIEVPVDMPEGISHEGVLGEDDEKSVAVRMKVREKGRQSVSPSGTRGGRSAGSGSGGGMGAATWQRCRSGNGQRSRTRNWLQHGGRNTRSRTGENGANPRLSRAATACGRRVAGVEQQTVLTRGS
jgi:Ca-activated chloride channel family protein